VPKQKTRRGAAKRFKRTGTGKLMRGKAYARHKLTHKSSKRKRSLGNLVVVDPTDARRVARSLPYV
jgi:large subunit ribosomal protein L35